MRLSGSEPQFDADDVPILGNNCYDYAFGDYRPSPKSRSHKIRNSNGNIVNRVPRYNKTEPGSAIGKIGTTFRTCGTGKNSMRARILYDNPRTVYALPRGKDSQPCKNGYYKVMSFVGTSTDGQMYGDFHFYKQVGAVRYRTQKGDTPKSIAKFFRVKESVIKEAMKHSTAQRNAVDGMYNDRVSEPTGRILKFPVNLWAHKQGWGTRPMLVDASGKTIEDPRKANRKYGVDYNILCGSYCVRSGKAITGNS